MSTLRSHIKSIFSTLDVTNRRAAAKRAAELDLLPRRRQRPRTHPPVSAGQDT